MHVAGFQENFIKIDMSPKACSLLIPLQVSRSRQVSWSSVLSCLLGEEVTCKRFWSLTWFQCLCLCRWLPWCPSESLLHWQSWVWLQRGLSPWPRDPVHLRVLHRLPRRRTDLLRYSHSLWRVWGGLQGANRYCKAESWQMQGNTGEINADGHAELFKPHTWCFPTMLRVLAPSSSDQMPRL